MCHTSLDKKILTAAEIGLLRVLPSCIETDSGGVESSCCKDTFRLPHTFRLPLHPPKIFVRTESIGPAGLGLSRLGHEGGRGVGSGSGGNQPTE